MADIRLRPSAEKDCVDIGDFTREEWSEAQAEIYLQKLPQTIRQIGERPFVGRQLSGALTGYRCRRSGSHLIFCIAEPDSPVQIEIVRILHEKTDIRRLIDEHE